MLHVGHYIASVNQAYVVMSIHHVAIMLLCLQVLTTNITTFSHVIILMSLLLCH